MHQKSTMKIYLVTRTTIHPMKAVMKTSVMMKNHMVKTFAKTDALYVHLMYKGTRISWKTALNDVNNFCKVVSISYSVGYTNVHVVYTL